MGPSETHEVAAPSLVHRPERHEPGQNRTNSAPKSPICHDFFGKTQLELHSKILLPDRITHILHPHGRLVR
jgi:hypothetical protein